MIVLGKLQKSANVDGLLVEEEINGNVVDTCLEDSKDVCKEEMLILDVKQVGIDLVQGVEVVVAVMLHVEVVREVKGELKRMVDSLEKAGLTWDIGWIRITMLVPQDVVFAFSVIAIEIGSFRIGTSKPLAI